MNLRNTKKVINSLRKRLEGLVAQYGLHDQRVLELSIQLDAAINLYFQAQRKAGTQLEAAD